MPNWTEAAAADGSVIKLGKLSLWSNHWTNTLKQLRYVGLLSRTIAVALARDSAQQGTDCPYKSVYW